MDIGPGWALPCSIASQVTSSQPASKALARTDDTVRLAGPTKVRVDHQWSSQRDTIMHASRRKHETTWSFTIPTACMNA